MLREDRWEAIHGHELDDICWIMMVRTRDITFFDYVGWWICIYPRRTSV
jgi:hypothetical protein